MDTLPVLCKGFFSISQIAKFSSLWHTVMIVCDRTSSCFRRHGSCTFYTQRQFTNARDATHSVLEFFVHCFFHMKFVSMSVVIYGVVHDHMETVFGLCTQLTGYGICF